MMKDSIEVEVNMTAARKKKRDEGEWRRDEGDRIKEKEPEQPSSSKSQEVGMDMMMKTMEKLMERIFVDIRPPPIKSSRIETKMLEGHKSSKIGREINKNLPIHLLGPHFRRNM